MCEKMSLPDVLLHSEAQVGGAGIVGRHGAQP